LKLTTREKRLLVILAAVLVLAVYGNYFLKPQLEAINSLNKEIEAYVDSYEMNMAYEKKVMDMESQIKIISQKIKDLRMHFPPSIRSEEALILIRDTAERAGLQINGITFEDFKAVETGGESGAASGSQAQSGAEGEVTDTRLLEALKSLGLSQHGDSRGKEGGEEAPIPDGKGFTMGVRLEAAGSNNAVKNFIKYMQASENRISFSDINIENRADGMLAARMTLNFYGIMDRNAEAQSLLKNGQWEPLELPGKDDIFRPAEGFASILGSMGGSFGNVSSGAQTGETGEVPDLGKYDFTMSVLPYGEGMAPPSVGITARSIPKEALKTRIPTIYGDSRGMEKVEFYFEEKDGKLYCKFKTEHEAFPDKRYDELIEFVPVSGSINIRITSAKREYEGDEGGVLLSIMNKTSKTVFVDVVEEDAAKPRIKAEKIEGDVKVIY